MTPPAVPRHGVALAGAAGADALILQRAELDLDEGIVHARETARAHAPALLKGAYEAAVMTAITTIHLRSRFREDVTFLLELAHRVNGGDDPETLARANLTRVLHEPQLAVLARHKDPEFAPLLEWSRANFAARLPDLARMVAVHAPADYDALVREAFPDRKRVDDIVEANRAHVQRVVSHLEAHPHLLRLPHAWVPRLAATAREVVDWQTERVRKGVDEIYRS